MARLVKRYSNRKLYDTTESRYVTLDEIARWVRAGEDVKITENENGEDLTAVTFAQIILEGVRKNKARVLVGPDATALDLIVRITGSGYQRLFSTVIARMVPETH